MNISPRNALTTALPEAYHALVLLVDDQPFVSEAVRRAFLNQPDIDYHYCQKPQEALAAAAAFKPTVILLDLVMPGISGLELLQQFRAQAATAETPIVMLSSMEEARMKSEAFALGANDYLVKLPDTVELRARVRYHSRAHLNRIQREAAFLALQQSQQQLLKKNTELHIINQEYARMEADFRALEKLLPVCLGCGQPHQRADYQERLARYRRQRAGSLPAEQLCPQCHPLEPKPAH